MTEKMSGNKGEWSELYTFLKLLSDGKIYAADERVNRIENVFFPILKIIREEKKGEIIEYVINSENIQIEVNNALIKAVSRDELSQKANYLLNEIVSNSNSFEIEEIAEYANGIKVTKIKAPSTDTTDITMQIEDVNTGFRNTVGFSIKSEIGSLPTLLNASEATNFVFKVTGISDKQMEEINLIDSKHKIKERMEKIFDYGGKLSFRDMNNLSFKRNLVMIDSLMPEILAFLLLYSYSYDIKECNDLIEEMGRRDPIGFGETIIYAYKFKKFLCSCALGMKPAKKWDGIDEANGGYIIVKSDGEVLAYHIYNRNAFEQYLLDYTKLEHASTSRHQYMTLYKENEDMYIKLNLQVRFTR